MIRIWRYATYQNDLNKNKDISFYSVHFPNVPNVNYAIIWVIEHQVETTA